MFSFNLRKIFNNWLLLPLILMVMVGYVNEVKGQYTKVRPTYVGPYPTNTGGTNGAGGTAGTIILAHGEVGETGTHSIATPDNLNDNNYTTNVSTLSAVSGGPGTGLGAGAGLLSTAYINLNFPLITPNQWNPIFIKATAVSNSRLNAYEQVSIQAYSGNSIVGSAVSMSSLAINSNGYYIFLPTANCTSIRIILTTDNGTSLLGLFGGKSTASVDVYDVYTFDPTCTPPTYTTTAVTGISLGGAVSSPDNAIDNDLDTKSTLSVGLLGLLSTIKQTVYFSRVSNPGDAATITFSVPQAVLNLGLFNGITLQAYNGATAIGTPIQISSLLSLDLLGLLGNSTRFTGSYIPSTSAGFDRIEISTSAVASVLQNFYVHEVQQTPAKPTFISSGSTTSATSCSGTSVTLKVDAPGTGNEVRWYSEQVGGTLLATANTYTTSPTITTTYYVAMAKTGCTAESERIPVKINVNPLPAPPIVQPTTICSGTKSLLGVANPLEDLTYNWYATASGGTILKEGNTYVTPFLTADMSYYIESVVTATGCVSSTRTKVTVTVNPLPTLLPITGNSAVCVNSTINLQNLTSGGTWSSSNQAIATINSGGLVTGIAAGNVNIIYAYSNGTCTNTVSFPITVNPLPVLQAISGVSSLCIGHTATLTNSVLGGNWTSSDQAIAVISNTGVVTSKSIGTVTITYTFTNAASCTSSITKTISIHQQIPTPIITLHN